MNIVEHFFEMIGISPNQEKINDILFPAGTNLRLNIMGVFEPSVPLAPHGIEYIYQKTVLFATVLPKQRLGINAGSL